jgi:hypothetical protein
MIGNKILKNMLYYLQIGQNSNLTTNDPDINKKNWLGVKTGRGFRVLACADTGAITT